MQSRYSYSNIGITITSHTTFARAQVTELFSELTKFVARVKLTLRRGHPRFLKSAAERDYIGFVEELLKHLAPLDPVSHCAVCLPTCFVCVLCLRV